MRPVTADLQQAARNLRAARLRLDKATREAQAITAAAYLTGTSESEIARQLGVTRVTVRKWIGK